MTRVKYATPAMVERAAQQCSVMASWLALWSPSKRPPRESALARTAMWEAVWLEPLDGDKPCDIWAEAEARLREGRLPDGWAWRCPARVADRCDGSCVRFDAVIATAWAPGKGPHL